MTLSSSPFFLGARWNKTMSWSTEAQVRCWGMLFTKKTTVLKHVLKPCSVTAYTAEMLLCDGHPAEYQEKSSAHSLFRIHGTGLLQTPPEFPLWKLLPPLCSPAQPNSHHRALHTEHRAAWANPGL